MHYQEAPARSNENTITFLKKIFGKQKAVNRSTPFPAEWNLTLSDLFEELKAGKRAEIKDPEMTWAREYERSLIPDGYRFPQKGDVYESTSDQEVDFLTSWSAPNTGGGTTILFAGEKIWLDAQPSDKKPIGVYLLALEYQQLEARIVSESDRNAHKYDSFCFYVSTKELNENFRLIETGFSKEKFT